MIATIGSKELLKTMIDADRGALPSWSSGLSRKGCPPIS